jgi:3-dehydroquinate synthase
MKTVRVSLGKRSYDVVIGFGLIDGAGGRIARLKLGKRALIITDPSVKRLYFKRLKKSFRKFGIDSECIEVPASEKSKSMRCYIETVKRVLELDEKQDSFLVALGGGVVGDLTGFIAATYKRGIPYAQIPTTLLAQVDSSIGGKTAIDLPEAKNLIGAFYQPRIVLTDIGTLNSLPASEMTAGMGEVIKYGMIKDAVLFRYLENNYAAISKKQRKSLEFIVWRCAGIKARMVGLDEYDKKGIRMVLNFGHTFAHGIEAAGGYRSYVHGEAVALGMLLACEAASDHYDFSHRSLNRLKNLIKQVGLPVRIDKGIKISKVIKSIKRDKKVSNGMHTFVIPEKIGNVRVKRNFPLSVAEEALKKLKIR